MSSTSILHLRLAGSDPERTGRTGTRSLAELCPRITPAWELTAGGAFLDLTGTERLYGRGVDGAAYVSRLARSTGNDLAAGSAPTRLAAEMASLTAARTGGGLLAIVSAQVGAFLQFFPVDFLPVRNSVIGRLQRLGVRTLGDLQVVPPALLRSVFGQEGARLSAEAWGQAAGLSTVDRLPAARNGTGLELVAGVRLVRPVSSGRLCSALCRGLAVRAMTFCPGGPASRGKWRLAAKWAEGHGESVLIPGPESPGWKSWLGLVGLLWRRLPSRRQGLVGLELWAEAAGTSSGRQGNLFPADEADCRLADAMRLVRREAGSRLGPACEDLLEGRGVFWYGPGSGLS